jgi:hypothetical protein
MFRLCFYSIQKDSNMSIVQAHNSVPRSKWFKRAQGLQSAKSLQETSIGKNIVKVYRQHYGVDWKATFTKLEILGIQIAQKYKKRVLESMESQSMDRRRKREEQIKQSEVLLTEFQDNNYAFIMVYTSGGAPCGIIREGWDVLAEAEGGDE